MNVEKLFKNLILLSLILLIFSFVYGMFLGATDTSLADEPMYIIDYIMLIFIVVAFINLYQLYKFKPIGKQLYVLLFILSFVLIPFLPLSYFESSKIAYFLDSSLAMISSAILVLLYYSEISEKFK